MAKNKKDVNLAQAEDLGSVATTVTPITNQTTGARVNTAAVTPVQSTPITNQTTGARVNTAAILPEESIDPQRAGIAVNKNNTNNTTGFNASNYLSNYPTYVSPIAGASYSYNAALPTYSYDTAMPTWEYNQATPGEFTYDRTRPADFSYDVARPADFAYDATRPEYSSAYQDQINAMVDQILNRPQFTYDYTTDPLYQQYAEAYTRNGKQAMNDTHAQLAARTGGLASSYAGTAAQQQYNQYMQALNDKIPELYQLAYGMYMDEGNNMRNNLGMIQGLENTDYGRYMDALGQYNTDRNFAYDVWQGQQNQYENDRNFAYNQWLANQDLYNTDRNFAYNQYTDAWDRYYNDRNFSYGQYQDQLGQWNTDRNFTYGQYIDALNQYNTDRNFNYNVWQDDLARQEAAARNAYNAQVSAYNTANNVNNVPPIYEPVERDKNDTFKYNGGTEVTMNKNGYAFDGKTYKTYDDLVNAFERANLNDEQKLKIQKSLLRNGILNDEEWTQKFY